MHFGLKILLAMKEGQRGDFTDAMAEFGTSFPAAHAEARKGLFIPSRNLYVTGQFPSLGIKKTYYHFFLRCGQIH